MRNAGVWLVGLTLALPGTAKAQKPPPPELPIYVLSDWKYYSNIGWQSYHAKRYDRAIDAFGIAIDRIKPWAATERELIARSYADLATVLHEVKRDTEAEPLASWALKVRETLRTGTKEESFMPLIVKRASDAEPQKESEHLRKNLELLAQIQLARKKNVEAETQLKRLLKLQEETIGNDDPGLIVSIELLAQVSLDQGKVVQAEPYYKRALALREQNSEKFRKEAEENDRTAKMMRQMYALNPLASTGRMMVINQQIALRKLEERATLYRGGTDDSLSAAVATEGLATVYRRTGRIDEADDLDDKARVIRDALETKAAKLKAGR